MSDPKDGWTVATLKEHNDALRAADQKYNDAMRAADERLRSELRAADEKFDKERDHAVQHATDTALASIEKATEVLARTYSTDKASQNEWRATINDIISKLGGMRAMWGWIVAAIMMAFAAWKTLSQGGP